jgi:hypothetical protein
MSLCKVYCHRFLFRVIYSFALRDVHILSFALSGEWCSIFSLVFVQALIRDASRLHRVRSRALATERAVSTGSTAYWERRLLRYVKDGWLK